MAREARDEIRSAGPADDTGSPVIAFPERD
jgi:hypothetical protein